MLVILTGLPLVVLIFGWGSGIDPLRRLGPGQPVLPPSAAFSFLILGVALLADSFLSGTPTCNRPPRARLGLLIAGGVAGLIAAANIVLLSLRLSPGVDGLFMPDLPASDTVALGVAFGQVLLAVGCILLAMGEGEGQPDRLLVAIATVGLALGIVALVGQLLDSETLHTSFVFSALSVRSSLLILFFSVALMMARPDGWIWLLIGEGRGSQGARRLFPAVVLGPLLLFTLLVAARAAGFFTANFRASLLALALILIGLLAILRNARIENEEEAKLKQALSDLEGALEDKEMLLREVYHRVKNNMQATDALIAIESTKFSDPEVLASFRAMSSRVQALATVHQMLIGTSRPSRISSRAFLSQLCASIEAGNGLAERGIRLVQDVEDDDLDLDAAILVGLLVNELIANAIKHAFVGREPGTVLVRYRRPEGDDSRRCFMVQDDGIGMPSVAEGEVAIRTGIGSRLIRGMVVQLKGEMEVETKAGTTVTVRFPVQAGREKSS